MNGDKELQSGSANRFNNEDDDYEDNGSGVEDDAPESFQSLGAAESPWATFPDLLRVQTSSANAATEDDSPESLSFAAAQPFRSNESEASASNYRTPALSILNNQPVLPGAVPKNRPALAPPDVSQIEQSNQSSGSSRHQESARPCPLPGRPPAPLPSNSTTQSRFQSGPSSSSYDNIDKSRFNQERHPHRNPINSLNLSSALYSTPSASHSSTSSSSAPSSSLVSSLSLSLAPIANTLARVQSSIDNLSTQVNERLDNLEARLNSLTLSVDKNSSQSNENSNQNSLDEISSDSMKNFVREQRRELFNERRAFLLTFAEALRYAAESSSRPSEPSTSGLNGPQL